MSARTDTWGAELREVERGFSERPSDGHFECLFCRAVFEQGAIYTSGERLVDAQRAAREHVVHTHGGALNALLSLDKRHTGLTDAQRGIYARVAQGLSDEEIAREMGVSSSTVRNQRFAAREKARQLKALVAILLLAEGAREEKKEERLVEPPKGTIWMDERFAITEKDRETTERNFFDANGQIVRLPAREKGKIIVMTILAKAFEAGKEYTEKEVNEILMARCPKEYVLMRRYLIDYGILERTRDCSRYWVK